MLSGKTQFHYFTLNIFSVGWGALYTILLARLLGAGTFGTYSVLMNIGFIVTPLAALIPNLILLNAHGSEGPRVSQSMILFFILLLVACTFPISLAILLYAPILEVGDFTSRLLALINIYGTPLLLTLQYFYQTQSRYAKFLWLNLWMLIARAGGLGLAWFGNRHVFANFGVPAALLINSLVMSLIFIFGVIDLGLVKRFNPSTKAGLTATAREIWRKVKIVFGRSLLICLWATLLSSLDVLLAQRNFSALDLSVYSILSSLSKLSLVLPSVVTPLVLEFGYKNQKNSAGDGSGLIRSLGWILMAGVTLSVLGHIFAPILLPVLIGRDFTFHGWAIPLLVLTMTSLSILSVYVHYEFGRGQTTPLLLSLAAMAVGILLLELWPSPLSLNRFCALLLVWPILNGGLLLCRRK